MDLDKEIDLVAREVISRVIDEKIKSGRIIDIINSKMSEDARLTFIGMIENEFPNIEHEIACLVYYEVKEKIKLELLSDGFFMSEINNRVTDNINCRIVNLTTRITDLERKLLKRD